MDPPMSRSSSRAVNPSVRCFINQSLSISVNQSNPSNPPCHRRVLRATIRVGGNIDDGLPRISGGDGLSGWYPWCRGTPSGGIGSEPGTGQPGLPYLGVS